MANNEGSNSGTGDNSQIELLSEIQNLRAEKDDILKQIELKIDAQTEKLTEHGQKFSEISEKLQSVEKLTSEISKIVKDVETNENSDKDVKTLEKLPNTIDSNVSKAMQKSEKRFVLKHVFKNVEKFVEGKSNISDIENHFSVDSCMSIKRLNDHLACFVQIRGPKDEIKWTVETKVNIKIDGRNQKSEDQNFDHCFKETEGWGFDKFLKWDQMKNEYLVDGKLTVEAHVQVIETSGFSKEKVRKFDKSNEEDSDVILVVNKKEFYVLRKYLAAQSSFFKALLLGNFAESKKSEITLTGIDPTDFHYFLEVLYGELAIDEYNVEGILLLADMYDAPTAIRRCENFLLNESNKSLKKKLQMATRYHLENLKNNCMEKIKTNEDVRSILPANINDMDHNLMAELLKKSISFR